MKDNHYILLTIDVEDWFQVENFKQCIPFSSWPSCELRVEKNIHCLLDLFDAFEQKKYPQNFVNPVGPSTNKIKATFFILGWVAERLPNLVREIHARGHEIASHGCNHTLCTKCSWNDLKTDLMHSKKLLEDIIGHRVYGYRAPSFAINNDILKIIEDSGYLYDSSYNSFSLHGRYGKLSIDGYPKKGIALTINQSTQSTNQPINQINPINPKVFYELPISNLKLGGLTFPLGGGGYFRIIPNLLFKYGVKSILKKENAYMFFMHPWEIDSEQPKVKDAFLTYKFRHYVNLKNTYSKLSKMIKNFQHCQFVTCFRYLNSQIKPRMNTNTHKLICVNLCPNLF
jgi:polysaccharide deacetylase family protein (PEP-CTERM system associated)